MRNSQDDMCLAHSEVVDKQREVARALVKAKVPASELQRIVAAEAPADVEHAAAEICRILKHDYPGIPPRFLVEAAGWALQQPVV